MTTPNIPLEQVPSNSLQPGTAVNDALQVLDALTRPGGIVQSRTETVPPATTGGDVGKRWIIPSGATGAWSGKTGQIALCTAAGLWRYFTPTQGWQAYSIADGADVIYAAGAWALVAAASTRGATINEQTGTNYTAVLGDANNVIEMNNAAANTLTIPPNATAAIPVGGFIEVWQSGAGQTTIAAGAGVSILRHSALTLKLKGQNSGCSLRKVATDTWRLVGDMETL